MASARVVQDAETLKALADPARLAILELMMRDCARTWTAKDLAASVGMPLQKIYYHLNLLEQRGLLHVTVMAQEQPVHVVVLHLGLIAGSRVRQIEQMGRYIEREVPRREALVVAGDFNDWGGKLRPVMNGIGLNDFIAPRLLTYPSRLPLTQLDYVYARGLEPVGVEIPRGRIWGRMSDHLPLIAEFKV